MGRIFLIGLEGTCYSCKYCSAHLALFDDVISKSFQSHNGEAYLFGKVVNVTTGDPEMRMMLTGHHIVSDIFCVGCGSIVGWKYLAAFSSNQKYKEGKFILERSMMFGPDGIQPDESQYLITHDGQLEEGAPGGGLLEESDGDESEDVL